MCCALLVVAHGAEADPPQPKDEPTETGAPREPPRPMTRSELQREIDLLQRELEELVVRIGADPPNEQQRTKLHDLGTKLAELRPQLESTKERDTDKAQGDGFKARWMRVRHAVDDFTNYDANDGMFRIRLGFKFQLDATAGRESGALRAQAGPIEESLDFRRARIFAAGRFLRRYDFKLVYDFGADLGFKDVFLEGARFTKYVKWRIGHFKEPFSLGRQSSTNNLGFLEWALPVQALTPGRNLGLMFRHTEAHERMFWAVAATTIGRSTDDNRTESDIAFTGRLTGLPLFRDEGRRLLHLGLSYSARNPSNDEIQVAARPEARFAPFFIDTGTIAADSATLVGVELAWLHRRFWRVQSTSKWTLASPSH